MAIVKGAGLVMKAIIEVRLSVCLVDKYIILNLNVFMCSCFEMITNLCLLYVGRRQGNSQQDAGPGSE